MKKTYSQPDILFESFGLCSSIAAGCAKKISTQFDGECGLVHGSMTIFTMDVNGCTTKMEDGSPLLNGLCYHVPVDANSLFNS